MQHFFCVQKRHARQETDTVGFPKQVTISHCILFYFYICCDIFLNNLCLLLFSWYMKHIGAIITSTAITTIIFQPDIGMFLKAANLAIKDEKNGVQGLIKAHNFKSCLIDEHCSCFL